MFKFLLVTVSCAFIARAQSPGVDSCIAACTNAAAAGNGCGQYNNISCVCTSPAFQNQALACLQQYCTPDQVTSAIQLKNQYCVYTGSGSALASESDTDV